MLDRSERSAEFARDEVLAALPQTVIQVDRDLRLVAVNHPDSPVFTRLASLGGRLEDLVEPDGVEHMMSLIDSARHGGTVQVRYGNGASVFQVTAKALHNTGTTLLVFDDITAKRRSEQTLVEMARGRSNLLATVSDSLLSPLAAVISYADLLSHPATTLDDNARKTMVHDMTDQAWDLAGIIEDLLTVAHTEIGDLQVVKVPVNLTANTAQVIESIGDKGSRIMVTGNRSTTGVGDPARFRQIVRNLLSNALVHGGEPVAVDISSTDTRAVLAVKDRGPGMPAPLEVTNFSEIVTGQEGETPNRAGIGLWICNALAELMGGDISYRRQHGLTVFAVSIPLLES